MGYNYCAHFIRSVKDLDVVRNRFPQTLFTPDKSEWLVGDYSEPQSDAVYEPDISIIRDFSGRAKAEVVYIFVDGMTDMFRYEHALNGRLLRKLLFLNNGLTAIWLAAEGRPEPWEDDLIFSARALKRALQSGWIQCGVQRGERDAEQQERFREELRTLYHEKRFVLNDVWPLCYVEELAHGIQTYYGMILPPRRNWQQEPDD